MSTNKELIDFVKLMKAATKTGGDKLVELDVGKQVWDLIEQKSDGEVLGPLQTIITEYEGSTQDKLRGDNPRRAAAQNLALHFTCIATAALSIEDFDASSTIGREIAGMLVKLGGNRYTVDLAFTMVGLVRAFLEARNIDIAKQLSSLSPNDPIAPVLSTITSLKHNKGRGCEPLDCEKCEHTSGCKVKPQRDALNDLEKIKGVIGIDLASVTDAEIDKLNIPDEAKAKFKMVAKFIQDQRDNPKEDK